MMLKNAKETRRRLNEFTFTEVIKIDGDISDCTFQKGKCHAVNGGYCKKCDDNGLETPRVDSEYANKGYRLRNISHGTHSLDFLKSMDIDADDSWSDAPVLFLMENPSKQICPFKEELFDTHLGGEKYPARQWYWIHKDGRKIEDTIYPKCFRQGDYGALVAGLIRMFKLGNAYLTNIVKCGMNLEKGESQLSTTEYTNKCIETCLNEVLGEEVKRLTENFTKKLLVFAFSQRVYAIAKEFLSKLQPNVSICLLPHPANRLANDYRKYVLFSKAYKFLKVNDVDVPDNAMEEFLENDKSFSAENIDFSGFEKYMRANGFEPESTEKKHKINKITYRVWTESMPLGGIWQKEISCYVYGNEGDKLGFGYNADDGILWCWDYDKKQFIDPQELSTRVGEESKAYEVFEKYINEHLKQSR